MRFEWDCVKSPCPFLQNRVTGKKWYLQVSHDVPYTSSPSDFDGEQVCGAKEKEPEKKKKIY